MIVVVTVPSLSLGIYPVLHRQVGMKYDYQRWVRSSRHVGRVSTSVVLKFTFLHFNVPRARIIFIEIGHRRTNAISTQFSYEFTSTTEVSRDSLCIWLRHLRSCVNDRELSLT